MAINVRVDLQQAGPATNESRGPLVRIVKPFLVYVAYGLRCWGPAAPHKRLRSVHFFLILDHLWLRYSEVVMSFVHERDTSLMKRLLNEHGI